MKPDLEDVRSIGANSAIPGASSGVNLALVMQQLSMIGELLVQIRDRLAVELEPRECAHGYLHITCGDCNQSALIYALGRRS